jgi:hypothetical protein
LKRKNKFKPADMLPSFYSDNKKWPKNCQALWLPAPAQANEDYSKVNSSIRKDILSKISSLKASHAVFDLNYSASVELFLDSLVERFLDEGKEQLTSLVDEYLPLFKAKPYELNHLER